MKNQRALTLPVALFAVLAAINGGLWLFLHQDQQREIREATAITARQAAIRLESALEARLSMVRHLQEKWRRGKINSRADYTREALDIHDTFAGVLALNRLDAGGVIRWVVPEERNRKAIGFDIRKNKPSFVSFSKARRTGQSQMTKAIDLVQGGKGFVVMFPLSSNEQFDGVISAVFRVREIVEQALGKGVTENYLLTVSEADDELYASPGNRDSLQMASRQAKLLDREWTITLTPNAATVERGTGGHLPLLFALAIVMSAALAWTLRGYLLRQEALARSEQRFKDLANSASDWFWEMDEAFRITSYFGAFEDTGRDPTNRIGKTRWEYTVDTDTDDAKWRQHKADLAAHRPYRDFQMTVLGQNGELLHTSSSGVPVFDEAGEFKGYRGTATDITEIKRREAALRQSEDNLATAQRIAHLGSWEWDFATDERRWSDEMYRIFGFEPGQIPSDRDALTRIIHPADQDQVLRDSENARRNKDTNYEHEYRIARPDGTIRQVYAVGEIIYHEDGTAKSASGTLRDITELKQARERLEASEQRFKDFASSGSDWLWEMDAELRFSQIIGPIGDSGRDPSDRIGKTRWEITADADTDDEKWRKHKADLAARRPFRNFQFSGFGQDGNIVHGTASGVPVFDADGEFTGYRGTGTDITELVEAEEKLQRSEENFRLLVEGSHQGMYVHDNFRPVFANQALVDLFGYDNREEILAQESVNVFFAPEERERVDGYAHARYRGEDVPDHYEAEGRRKDGSPIWLQVSVQFVNWEGRRLLRTTFVDITERKKAEEQFRQAQKMEAIGQLTGGVAHDFNNLLAIMMGNLALLEQDLGPDSESIELVEPTIQAIERAAALTQRMLAFSRQQPLAARRVNANDLLHSMQLLIQRSLVEDIDVRFDLSLSLHNCQVDPGQLEQAVLNMAINARDAMPQGGRLRIETANVTFSHEDAPDKRPAGMVPGDYVMIAVSDDGVGIPSEALDKIFDPFFTTKDVGEGTGLGLSMVYGFVKQSEGFIYVDSSEGKGTTFRVYLPAVAEGTPAFDEPVVAEVNGANGETVLVVEDERGVRMMTSKMLKMLGYQVHEASDASAALEKLRLHPDIDLMLTDILLPGGINGQQLADEAQADYPALKIMFVSGYAHDAIVKQGRLNSGANLLSKPFSPKFLARMLRETLDAS